MADQWIGFVGEIDDFGEPIVDEFVDGATKYGPWAMMAPVTFEKRGLGVGPGKGQRYRLIDNIWKKVEG